MFTNGERANEFLEITGKSKFVHDTALSSKDPFPAFFESALGTTTANPIPADRVPNVNQWARTARPFWHPAKCYER